VLTVFFIQLVFVLQDNLASRLPTGSVSALVYGWLFMQLPESLIGTALGTALLPTLSEQIVNDDIQNFRSTLEKSIRVIIALTLPITIILAINLGPLIQVLGFTESGTNLVLWTSRAFLVGLVGHSLLEVATRSFYAQQNAKTPLIASGLALAAFTLIAIPLSKSLGAPGIGLANSLAYTGEALLLFFLLYRRMPFHLRLKKTLLRAGAACVIGGGLSILLQTQISTSPSILVNLVISVGILTLSSGIILPILLPELKDLFNI
jgi:putative peptidoglycan lipid II flippase